jgi:hypothetical protein
LLNKVKINSSNFTLPKKAKQTREHHDSGSQWSWNWGQLPERQQPAATNASVVASLQATEVASSTSSASGLNKNKDSTSSSSRILDSMRNLIGSTNSEAKSSNGGVAIQSGKQNVEEIYLDDTEKLDSEVAALYLNQKSNLAKAKCQPPAAINLTKGIFKRQRKLLFFFSFFVLDHKFGLSNLNILVDTFQSKNI